MSKKMREKIPSGGLRENETIVGVYHPCWWGYLGGYIISVLFILLLGLPLLVVGVGVAVIFLILGGLIFLLTELTKRGHKYFVTNQRVIDEFKFITRKVRTADYKLIADAGISQGLWGRIFHYGNIDVRTASGQPLDLKSVRRPEVLQQTIMETKRKSEKEKISAPPTSEKENIPKMIEDLNELKKKGVITEEEFEKKKKDLLKRL